MTFVPAISLSAAMADPQLFGNVFAAPSYWTWKVVAKLIDGIPLTEPREIELFRECTGCVYDANRHGRRRARRLILLVGRRGGKDRFLSAVAVWRAALCADWKQHVSAGEGAVAVLLGADRRQAAILSRYCAGLLAAPLLAPEVVRSTGEAIEFRNGASLEISTNDARLVRGRSAIAVLGSECCYWRTEEHSSSSDEEVVGAAEPSLSMCPDGGVMVLGSSVYRKRGYMHRRWKELHGNVEADDLCWLAPSRTMNPRLPQSVIDKAMAEDGARARAEYLGIWREDVSDFLPRDVIEAATDRGVLERPPQPYVNYVAFADPAGGTGRDSFTLAVAHREVDPTGRGHDRAVLDVLRERKPRFVPKDVVAEYSDILRRYRVTEVRSDRYASAWAGDEWSRNNIRCVPSDLTKTEIYLSALPLLLSNQARLLDVERMRRQFTSLERRVHAGGRESVDDAGAASSNDDLSNAASGALVLAMTGPPQINWAARVPEILQQISHNRIGPQSPVALYGRRGRLAALAGNFDDLPAPSMAALGTRRWDLDPT